MMDQKYEVKYPEREYVMSYLRKQGTIIDEKQADQAVTVMKELASVTPGFNSDAFLDMIVFKNDTMKLEKVGRSR